MKNRRKKYGKKGKHYCLFGGLFIKRLPRPPMGLFINCWQWLPGQHRRSWKRDEDETNRIESHWNETKAKTLESRGECNFNFQRQVINKSKRIELKAAAAAAAVASAIDSLRCEWNCAIFGRYLWPSGAPTFQNLQVEKGGVVQWAPGRTGQ